MKGFEQKEDETRGASSAHAHHAPGSGAAGGHQNHEGHSEGHSQGGGHGHWMMIACCIPMLVIAIVLVATGVVGAGFILIAVLCTAMMALMMGSMSHGGGGPEGR